MCRWHVNIQTSRIEPQGKLKKGKLIPTHYTKTVARNEVECGYTERHVNIQTFLTEPQGKLKRPNRKVN